MLKSEGFSAFFDVVFDGDFHVELINFSPDRFYLFSQLVILLFFLFALFGAAEQNSLKLLSFFLEKLLDSDFVVSAGGKPDSRSPLNFLYPLQSFDNLRLDFEYVRRLLQENLD